MEWVGAGISLLAAGVAVWQAIAAGRARKEAKASEEAASASRGIALQLKERMAVALESSAASSARHLPDERLELALRDAVAELRRPMNEPRWTVIRRTQVGRSLVNGTRELARDVQIEVVDPRDWDGIAVRSGAERVIPNGYVDLRVIVAWGSPPSASIRIKWLDDSDVRHSEVIHLKVK